MTTFAKAELCSICSNFVLGAKWPACHFLGKKNSFSSFGKINNVLFKTTSIWPIQEISFSQTVDWQIVTRKSCYGGFCKKWEGCRRNLLAPVDVGMCGWTFTSIQCANRLKCSRSAGPRRYVSRLETPNPSHYLAHLKLSCTNPRGPTAREQPDPPPRFLVSHPGTAARRRRRGGGRWLSRRRRTRARESGS